MRQDRSRLRGSVPVFPGIASAVIALHVSVIASSAESRPTEPLGGRLTDASIAGAVQPMPLPNAAVFQGARIPARTDTLTITLPAGGKTEVMAVVAVNKVFVYTWKTDKGVVYVDFHGHAPDWANKKAFVQYLEAKDGLATDSGSLVAPFTGEHGWYWVNRQQQPVTITLTVTGFHESVKNPGAQ